MRKQFILNIILLNLFCTTLLFSQTVLSYIDMDFPQVGTPRAFSMGGIYTATNAGVDALNGNPAGLINLKRAQFIISGSMNVAGKNEYEFDYYKDRYDDISYSNNLDLFGKFRDFTVAFPVEMSNSNLPLVAAVGLRPVHDGKIKTTEEYENKEGNTLKETTTQKGIISTLSLGAATEINNRFQIGASLNIPLLQGFSSLEEGYLKTPTSDGGSSGSGDTGGTGSSGFEKDNYENELEADISGGSFLQLGGIMKVTPKLSLGLSYMFGHQIKVKDAEYTNTFNGEKRYEYELDDTKIKVPSTWSLGLAYQPNQNILISGQIDNLPWENIEIDGDEYGDYSDIENGYAYRVGLEMGSRLLLRLGAGMRKEDMTDDDDDPLFSKWVSGGFGIRKNSISIDAGARISYLATEHEYNDKNYDHTSIALVAYAGLKYAFDFSFGI